MPTVPFLCFDCAYALGANWGVKTGRGEGNCSLECDYCRKKDDCCAKADTYNWKHGGEMPEIDMAPDVRFRRVYRRVVAAATRIGGSGPVREQGEVARGPKLHLED